MITIGNKNAYPQLSWKPKPKTGFKISDGGSVNCGWIVNFIDTSVILNPCNSLGDSCDAIVEWFWKFGSGRSSKQQNPKENYNWGPIYENNGFNVTLVIKTKYGFKDSITNYLYIAEPEANFKVKGDTVVKVGDPVTFQNRSGLYFNPRWEWNFGDGTVFTNNSKKGEEVVHVYWKPGIYEVYLKLEDTIRIFSKEKICRDIFPDIVSTEKKIIIRVNELVKEAKYSVKKITLFPNPTKDCIKIKGIENGEMRVYDYVGREVLRAQINNELVDVSALMSGSYIVQILKDSFNYKALLIIE